MQFRIDAWILPDIGVHSNQGTSALAYHTRATESLVKPVKNLSVFQFLIIARIFACDSKALFLICEQLQGCS